MKSHRNVTPRQEALAERNLYAALAALTTIGRVARFLAGGNGGYAVAVRRVGRTGKEASRHG
jgi:uncharacterized protein YerC